METFKDIEKLVILDQNNGMLEVNNPKIIPRVGEYILDFDSVSLARVVSVAYKYSDSTVYVRVNTD